MRPWKALGLAAFAGVAATGVVIVRAERRRRAYTPAEVRARLQARLAEAGTEAAGTEAAGTEAAGTEAAGTGAAGTGAAGTGAAGTGAHQTGAHQTGVPPA
jgi:hypothetical protein